MNNSGIEISVYLEKLGIKNVSAIEHNPSYEKLRSDELNQELTGTERGQLTQLGAVNVNTGKYTGRSPKDKYIVMDDVSKEHLWWRTASNNNDNKPMSEDVWHSLKQRALNELSSKTLYVVDAFCGANADTRLKVRFIMGVAWQAHFVKNMFIRPSPEELKDFDPDFVVINAAKCNNPEWQKQGLNSETFVAFNLTEKMQIIGGTWYGGEMKKGMFSMMNYYLPLREIACMHCAANVGEAGDVAVFFGLSGTGKTTLSADPKRALIGDDEHGWDQDGVFNLEGGCYAKTIDLDAEKEPDIYKAIRQNALLENVAVDDQGNVDFSDSSKTENTRVSYPIDHIDNIVKPVSKAGHANTVIFLTADAFGVLPPVAKLDRMQAQYYYLSGYTSKVAGTELGITQPTPTFSACFGQAFLTLHPTAYARELTRKIQHADAEVYFVNTGWNGRGQRIDLKSTRKIIDAILNRTIDWESYQILPYFNLCFPNEISGVDASMLDPRKSFGSYGEWGLKAKELAEKFEVNFEKFADNESGKNLVSAGPKS